MSLSTAGVAVAALVLASIAVGCSKDRKGLGDSPVDKGRHDDQAPYIINMPNGFMNLAQASPATESLMPH